MAQDIKKGTFNIKGELDRTFPRIFKYDAGPNQGTFRSEEEFKKKNKNKKKKKKKEARSGNIGNIDMSDFVGSSAILGKGTNTGKKMSSSRNKYKVKNEKEDGMLASLYKSFSRKSSSYDPTKSNLGGQRLGQRKAGGIIKAKNGTLTDKAYEIAQAREEGGRFSVSDIKLALRSIGETSASVSPTLLKKAKKLAKEKGGRFSKKDIDMALKSLSGKKKKPNLGQRKAGGMMNSYNKGGLPDFSGDGKITKKDVLMGRGVIPKPKKASKGTMIQAKGCGVARKKKTKIT